MPNQQTAIDTTLQWFHTLSISDKIAIEVGLASIFVGVVSALLGAFAGSYSAFLLGRRQQKQDSKDKKYSALIAAQYALISQWDILQGVKKNHLDPNRSNLNRHLMLPPFRVPLLHYPVPFSDITFIAESEQPDLLHQIHLAEQSFLTSIKCIELRCEQFLDIRKDPALEHKETLLDKGISLSSIAVTDIYRLKQATDQMYAHIDKALPLIQEDISKIGSFIKTEYKRHALNMTPKTKQEVQETGLPAAPASP